MREKSRIFLFLVLIFGLTIGSLLVKPKAFSEEENRYLAEKPEFSWKALFEGSYTSDYESFITDQFIGRNQWIGWKTDVERLMLRQDINGVYFCRDHYLMEKHKAATFESDLAERNLAYLASFVEKYQADFAPEQLQVLLVPTASQVLKEKLPAFAAPYDQSRYVARLKEKLTDGILLDAEEVLREHREDYIYYRTDHHWTAFGAFYAYQKWCERTGLEAFGAEDFEIEEAATDFAGTLDSKVNTKVKKDSIYLYHWKEENGKREYTLTYDQSEDVRDTLYDRTALEGKDKYAVYLGGNYGEVDIRTNLSNGKTLLVIKDSFAHSFVPLAVNHYERVLMVDLRYFHATLGEYIKENQVTDILVLYNLANLATDRNLGKLTR